MKKNNDYIKNIIHCVLIIAIMISFTSYAENDFPFSVKVIAEEIEYDSDYEAENLVMKYNEKIRIWNDNEFQLMILILTIIGNSKSKPYLEYIPKELHSKLIHKKFLTTRFSTSI